MLFGAFVYYNVYKKNEFATTRRISLAVSLTLLLAFITTFFEFLEHYGGPRSYGAISVGLTLGIMLIIFLTNPHYIFLVNSKIYHLILLKDDGRLVYAA